MWNKLPKEVMQDPCMEVFKIQLDKAKSNLLWSFIWPWFEYKASQEQVLSTLPIWNNPVNLVFMYPQIFHV